MAGAAGPVLPVGQEALFEGDKTMFLFRETAASPVWL